MVFVNCPICGRKLLEGKSGSFVQVKCCHCASIVQVEVQELAINLTVITAGKKQ